MRAVAHLQQLSPVNGKHAHLAGETASAAAVASEVMVDGELLKQMEEARRLLRREVQQKMLLARDARDAAHARR